MGSFLLSADACLVASRTLLQRLLVCLNFTFEWEDLFLWYKWKTWFLNYGSSTRSWKSWRWVRLNLILSLRDIYVNSNLNPLIKFTSSNRSTKFKDILPWNISQMIMKNVPISTTIVISYETELTRSISFTRICKPVLMMDAKVSKDKNSTWLDGENFIHDWWNRIKNRAQRRRRWSIKEKQVRHWVK